MWYVLRLWSFFVLTTIQFLEGQPCDATGVDLLAGAPPPLPNADDDEPFAPFDSQAEFELADLLYRRVQMSKASTDDLMQIWAAYNKTYFDDNNLRAPFNSADDILATIDAIPFGECAWEAVSFQYDPGDNIALPDDAPTWQKKPFDVWYRDPLILMEQQLANVDFKGGIDYAAKKVRSQKNQKRQFCDLLSGNWAWEQSVRRLAQCSPTFKF